MVKIIIGVIIVAFIVIGGFMLLDPNMKSSNTNETTETSDANSYTIEGEISIAGTYKITGVVAMSDLIEAAGGVTNNADEKAYFETTELTIGDTYYIAPKYDTSDVCSNTPISKVNVNSDSADELTAISGITTTIANSIVSYRLEIGTYQTLEELMDVYGIGNATYRKIRNYITLQ
ncbi:MAG: helix-hairpin-helix domain-containing protein [Bacilli bacterium]|jgi:competence protein ComEA